MNSHCGITGSTYRPVERETYVRRMEPDSDPFAAARGVFSCLIYGMALALGVLVGVWMGVKL